MIHQVIEAQNKNKGSKVRNSITNTRNTACPLVVNRDMARPGVPLVGGHDITSLVKEATERGVATEMAVLLGFLSEKPFQVPSDGASSPHPVGCAFTALRLLKEWIAEPEEARYGWCKSNMVLHDVFSNVLTYTKDILTDKSSIIKDSVIPHNSLNKSNDRSEGQGHLEVTGSTGEEMKHKSCTCGSSLHCINVNCNNRNICDDIHSVNVEDQSYPVKEHQIIIKFNMDSNKMEEMLMDVLLTQIPDGLHVYTGSTHVGYCSVTNKVHRIKLPVARNTQNPPAVALVFELHSGLGESVRKCILYPTSDCLKRYIDSLDEKESLRKHMCELKDSYIDVEVNKFTPLLCEKLSGDHKGLNDVKSRMIKELRLSGMFVSISKETNSLILSVPREVSAYKVQIISKALSEVVKDEKEALLADVTSFGYPEPGSDVTVGLGAGGSVLDVSKTFDISTGSHNLTFSLYACGEVSDGQLNVEYLSEIFGRVEKLPQPDEETVKSHKVYIWCRIHCTSEDKARLLLNDRGGWIGHLPHNTLPMWVRPAISSDGNYLSYLKIPVRSAVKVITKVMLKKKSAAWNPCSVSDGNIRVCGKGCKVLWFGDGTGSIKLPQTYHGTKRNKILQDVRKVYGDHVDISLETSPVRGGPHSCFNVETNIMYDVNSLDSDLLSTGPYWINPKPRAPDDPDDYEEYDINFPDASRGMDFIWTLKERNEYSGYPFNHGELEYDRPVFCMSTILRPDAFGSIKDNLISFGKSLRGLNVELNVSRTKSGKICSTVSGEDRSSVSHVGSRLRDLLKPDMVELNIYIDSEASLYNAIMFLSSSGGSELITKTEKKYRVKLCYSSGSRSLAVYGSEEPRMAALAEVLEYLKRLPVPKKVHTKDNHVVIPMLKMIMKTYGSDLGDLCKGVKAECVCWDHKEGCFMVWGSVESTELLKSKVDEMSSFLESVSGAADGPTCAACLCPIEEKLLKLVMCGHAYCSSCLDLHVDIAIKDRNFPILCVAHECNELLMMFDIIGACGRTRSGTRHLLDAAVGLYIAQQGKESPIAHCLTPDCPAVYFVPGKNEYTGEKTTCTICKASRCNKCHVTPFHDDYTCAMWRNRDHVDRETAHWFGESVKDRKQCPACAVGIEKVSGCYNVRCGNCQRSICFQCGRAFATSSQCYGHKCPGSRQW